MGAEVKKTGKYAECVKFGASLRKLRRDCAMTQDQLALATKFDRSYIAGLENGHRNPTLMTIVRLAKALNVKEIELLRW